ncbi:hypothetical protein ACIOG8_34625 [Streptomyces erythrochromogenes]|uniref:hypothetical protein n=1 Tax=Streptomyces erythrochromogenes TaxID=285574 RepID=UPI00381EFD3E
MKQTLSQGQGQGQGQGEGQGRGQDSGQGQNIVVATTEAGSSARTTVTLLAQVSVQREPARPGIRGGSG